MRERLPSQTARNVAVWRALHLLRDPEPKIFRDIFARALAGFDSDEEMFRWVADNPRAANRNTPFSFALRHRYTEDQLRLAIAGGASQYVILGAGLDSFALRHPKVIEEVDVYEVDHPASQRWKRNRVEQLGLTVPNRLIYVPIDFERTTLTEGLIEAGLDSLRPTFFSCLGVTQYLTREANLNLFGEVAQLTIRSTLVLEFISPPETLPDDDAAIIKSIADGTAAVGEPWLSFFSFDDMEGALKQCGFEDIERFGAAEAYSQYALAQTPHLPAYFRMIAAKSGNSLRNP